MNQECVLFVPQVQTHSGQWIEVGIPVSTLEDALKQRVNFPLNHKLIAFRVIQTSCSKQQIQRKCCGG